MKKWIWIALGTLVCIIILLLWALNSAKEDFVKAEEKAIKWAFELTSLSKVDHTEFFAGEMDFTVVFGNDKDGEELIIWVNDKMIHEKKASDGLRKSDIRQLAIERQGSIEIVRTTPGRLGEMWIWEVFYKKEEADGWRYYYDYYTFRDGEWIDTYKLHLVD